MPVEASCALVATTMRRETRLGGLFAIPPHCHPPPSAPLDPPAPFERVRPSSALPPPRPRPPDPATFHAVRKSTVRVCPDIYSRNAWKVESIKEIALRSG